MDVKLGGSPGLAVTLAALALVAACQHSTDAPEGGGANAAAAICAETAPAYCQHWFSCYPEEAREYFGSMQSCQTDEAAACRVYGGLAGVSPTTSARWSECNRAGAARSCNDPSPLSELCTFLPGTRAVGEACVYELQCATLNCKVPPRGDSAPDAILCGTCAPQPVVGDPCVEYDDCGFDGLACVSDKCVKREDLGGPCETSVGCKRDLVCLEGKCGPGRGEGEACTDGSECATALRCVRGTCGTGLPAGAACTRYFECQSFGCEGAPSRCQEVANSKVVGVGEPCGRVAYCTFDARCDEASKKCVAYKRQGEACARHDECFHYLACQAGKCQPLSDEVCK